MDTYYSNDAFTSNTRYEFTLVDAANQKQEIIESDVYSVLSRDKTKVLLYTPQSTTSSFKIFYLNRNQSIPFMLNNLSSQKAVNPTDALNKKTWSPDGTYVISSWYRENSMIDVVTLLGVELINVNTSNIYSLDMEKDYQNANDYWRIDPEIEWVDTHWILYITQDDDLTLMNLQTSERIVLNVKVEDIVPTAAIMSPDKSMVAVQSSEAVLITYLDKDEQPQHRIPIGFLNTHTGGQIIRPELHHTDYYDFDWAKYVLAWSPDSSMLAFVADTGTSIEHPELIVVSRDGKELLRKHLPGFIAAYVNWVECDSK